MRWPWSKELETRASSYTDTLISALVSRVQGQALAIPGATGALESCAGLIGRGFAACEIGGPESMVAPITPTLDGNDWKVTR